ncbi:MAG: hypothetical protein ACFCBW_12150 [Candidatus Competibacterales bacterium]
MTPQTLLAYCLVSCWLFPAPGKAITLSLDLDPTTPGIQDTATVAAGDAFDVDLFIDVGWGEQRGLGSWA